MGFELPGLNKGSLAMAEGLELDDLYDRFQTKPFWDSMILSHLGDPTYIFLQHHMNSMTT